MRALSAVCLSFFMATAVAAEPAACPQTCAAWPERFFAGRSEGKGVLRILLAPARAVRVSSEGRLLKSGTLILRQTIREDGEPPTTREWKLSQVRPGRYRGVLTEAIGAVTGEARGNRLHLTYTMRGACRVRIDQELVLQRDGRTVQNTLTASKFGLPLASLRETIRKTR